MNFWTLIAALIAYKLIWNSVICPLHRRWREFVEECYDSYLTRHPEKKAEYSEYGGGKHKVVGFRMKCDEEGAS